MAGKARMRPSWKKQKRRKEKPAGSREERVTQHS